MKMPNLGSKMPYFSIFGPEFLKTIVIFEISTLEFVNHESLTHTMNFIVGSAFSKGLGSAFSDIPGPAPGLMPIYFMLLNFLVF